MAFRSMIGVAAASGCSVAIDTELTAHGSLASPSRRRGRYCAAMQARPHAAEARCDARSRFAGADRGTIVGPETFRCRSRPAWSDLAVSLVSTFPFRTRVGGAYRRVTRTAREVETRPIGVLSISAKRRLPSPWPGKPTHGSKSAPQMPMSSSGAAPAQGGEAAWLSAVERKKPLKAPSKE
jgi:hypothetical protein